MKFHPLLTDKSPLVFLLLMAVFLFFPSIGFATSDWAAPATEFLDDGVTNLKTIGKSIAIIAIIAFAIVSFAKQQINWGWGIGIGIGALILSVGPQILEGMIS